MGNRARAEIATTHRLLREIRAGRQTAMEQRFQAGQTAMEEMLQAGQDAVQADLTTVKTDLTEVKTISERNDLRLGAVVEHYYRTHIAKLNCRSTELRSLEHNTRKLFDLISCRSKMEENPVGWGSVETKYMENSYSTITL